MVRLLRAEMEVVQNPDDGFNPTMVRLLPKINLRNPCKKHRFQSHNGAIAA